MLAEGLEVEARRLYPYKHLNALQTVGYKELFAYFDGRCSRDEAVELIKRNTRRYAKRQLTWFRRDPEIFWTPPGDTDKIIAYIDGRCKSVNFVTFVPSFSEDGCSDGGIGRHAGLKILWPAMAVRVRFPPEYGPTANRKISGRFYFHRPQSDVIQRAIRFRPGFNFQTIADRTINFRTATTLF